MGLGAKRVRTAVMAAEGIRHRQAGSGPLAASRRRSEVHPDPPASCRRGAFCYSRVWVSPRPSWLSLEAATMKLLLDRLTGSPTPYRFQTAPGWWRASLPARHGLPAEVSTPFVVELRAHRMGEDVYLEGTISGALEFECSRCLARYRHASHEPFRLVLEPAGSRVPADPEAAEALARDGMCLGEDVRDGLVPGRGDRSRRVRAGGDRAVAPCPASVSGGLPRAVSAMWGGARAGCVRLRGEKAGVALRGAGQSPPRAE